MSEFDDLCKVVEGMKSTSYSAIIAEKSAGIITALSAINKNGMDGLNIYLNFILCSIAADGKLSPEEYEIVRPLVEKFMGKKISYPEAKSYFKEMGLNKSKDYKEAADRMIDVLGLVSTKLKTDIVIVCLIICAVDGKISHKEKKWIAQLIE